MSYRFPWLGRDWLVAFPFKGTAASTQLEPDQGSPLYTGWTERATLSIFAGDAGKDAAGPRVHGKGLGDRELSRE